VAPISVRSIKAGDSLPERKDYELTFKFKVCTFGDSFDCPAIEKALNNILNDWREGRPSFDVELISEGAARCLKRAQHSAIEAETQREFGRELVPDADGRGKTGRWYLEAVERAKKIPSFFFSDAPKADFVRRDT